MAPRKKAVRKDKPVRDRWVVVHTNDVTTLRYPPVNDCPGYSEEQARRLCSYPIGSVDCWRAIKTIWLAGHARPGMTFDELIAHVGETSA